MSSGTSGPPVCALCGSVAPYGDARINWIYHHDGIPHRLWWAIKQRLGGRS